MVEQERILSEEEVDQKMKLLQKELISITEIEGKILVKRDERALTQGERSQLFTIRRLKDKNIVSLLELRARNGLFSDVNVRIYKHPSERIHRFSMNSVRISFPYVTRDRQVFIVKAQFSDLSRLRKEKSAAEVYRELLPKTTVGYESDEEFEKRTKREINGLTDFIIKLENNGRYSAGPNRASKLEKLKAIISEDRLGPDGHLKPSIRTSNPK